MKHILLFVLSLLLMTSGGIAQGVDRAALGLEYAQQLMAGEYDAVYDRFSERVKQAFTVDQLKSAMEQLPTIAGEFVRIGDVAVQEPMVQVALIMERKTVNLLLGIEEDGTLNALTYTLPPEPIVLSDGEEDVAVGKYNLPGTLTLPSGDGPFPAVVLVHGSGPQDRNESIGNSAVFSDIARGFQKMGIATLRYDKRTLLMNQGKIPVTPEEVAAITVFEETVEDAVAAAQQLKDDPRIDGGRIFIIGHSLGGMLATGIQASGADAAGLIILAGSLRHLNEILIDQIGAESTAAMIAPLKAYFDDEASRDYAAIAEAVNTPMLILQGADDVQVFADKDYPLWLAFKEAHPDMDITCTIYDGLGHLFTENDVFSPTVLADMGGWILRQE